MSGANDSNMKRLKIAFVGALSDKKMLQKLEPLAELDIVDEIALYRRFALSGKKISSHSPPKLCEKSALLSEFWRFFELLANGGRYDVFVGCNQIMHGVVSALVARLRGKPVIQMLTTDVDLLISKPLSRWTVLSADACAVRGAVSAEKLRKAGFARPIEIIANVFPQIPPRKAHGSKCYDIIFVSHYTSDAKDFPWLLRILVKLKESRPDFKIALAGQGHSDKLGAQVRSLGLSKNVVFTGELHDLELEKCYLNSRLMLLTSKVEGLPMVIIEAMSLGIPMVVTNVGDIEWLLQDSIQAFIVKNGDTESAVSSISRLLEDLGLRESMGTAARRRYDELIADFQTPRIAEAWRRLIGALQIGDKC